MKQLTLLLAFVLNVTAEVIWFNNGRSIDGTY